MILSAEHVSYRYRSKAHTSAFALRDVTVAIERGSLTGLLGPNGCGKTTLLRLLAGILQPNAGTVTLDGRSLRDLTRRAAARRIAIVPQETHPAFDYTAMEMVLMGRHPHLGLFELESPNDIDVAYAAMSSTGTDDLADRAYMTLSGGEKQRVIIASALAQEPEVLLLDEPTASLDLGYQVEIASLLARLTRERSVTMVMATHDLNLAASICDTLVLMRDGQILAQGGTADVLTGDAVQRLYGVGADVRFHDAAGHLVVVPVGPARSEVEGRVP